MARLKVLGAGLMVMTLMVACQGATATSVSVTVLEWAVVADDNGAPAGEVTFSVTNTGPDGVHEFVIIRTDLDPGELPTDEHGAVDEAAEGIEVVDRIEEIPVGDTAEVTVELEAGTYVLLCNIYTANEAVAHYAMGMRAAFTVEGG